MLRVKRAAGRPRRATAFRLASLAVMGALIVGACSSGQPSNGSAAPGSGDRTSIVLPLKSEPRTLNPNWQQDPAAFDVGSNLYDRLINVQQNGSSVYAGLAETWETSPDAREFTFHLRDGLKWHDGTALTSADVVYTYETIIENKYPLATYLAGATIEAPDAQTVVVTFAEPKVSFLPLLGMGSQWFGAILPKHIWEGNDWSKNPPGDKWIGSGPFKFVSWQAGTSLALTANADYFLGAPAVQSMTIRFVADNQVALAGFNAGEYPLLPYSFASNYSMLEEHLDKETGPRTVTKITWYDRSLFFNLQRPLIADERVREAIGHALNRDQLSELAFSGLLPGQGTIGNEQSFEGWTDPSISFPEHNVERAKQLLDEAGHPEGADGTRFKLVLAQYPLGDVDRATEVVVEQLAAIGIEVDWQKFDRASFYPAVEEGNIDAFVYFVRYGPDPSAISVNFTSEGQENYGKYANDEVDDLFAELGSTPEVERRREIYREIQRTLREDIPYLPLYSYTNVQLNAEGWTGSYVELSEPTGWFSMHGLKYTGTQ